MYFIRFSDGRETIAPPPGFRCVRDEGLRDFSQTDNRALQYAGILDTDDGGQLPAVCIKALDVLLGVILVHTFYFQLFYYIFFFFNLPIMWRCGPGAELSNAKSSTVIFLACDPVLWLFVRTGSRGCGAHIGVHLFKRNLFSLFLWTVIWWTIQTKKNTKGEKKKVLAILLYGIPRELAAVLTHNSFFFCLFFCCYHFVFVLLIVCSEHIYINRFSTTDKLWFSVHRPCIEYLFWICPECKIKVFWICKNNAFQNKLIEKRSQ